MGRRLQLFEGLFCDDVRPCRELSLCRKKGETSSRKLRRLPLPGLADLVRSRAGAALALTTASCALAATMASALESATDADQAIDDAHEPASLLARLPPPTPYSVLVRDLSIQAPVPRWLVPVAIPFTVPRWVQRRLQKGDEAVPTELVRSVSVDIAAGEVLAMCVEPCSLLCPNDL